MSLFYTVIIHWNYTSSTFMNVPFPGTRPGLVKVGEL